MMPFHAMAVAHPDILEGRLTLDVFAADLWEVFKGTVPDEDNCISAPSRIRQRAYLTSFFIY